MSTVYDKYMKLGDIAFDEGNAAEAYDYYKSCVEESENTEAVLKKGYTAMVLSTPDRFRIREFTGAVKRADANGDDVKEYVLMLLESSEEALEKKTSDFYKLSKKGNLFEKDLVLYERADFAAIHVLDAMRFVIDYAERQNDVEMKKRAMKIACKAIHFICIDFTYYKDKDSAEMLFGGRSYPDKKEYIAEYDEYTYFIRTDEPDFRKEDGDPINRIAPQKEVEIYEDQRSRVMVAMQRYKDNDLAFRRIQEKKEAELEKKKLYWADHPEEYEKYLKEMEEMKELHKRFMQRLKEYDDYITETYEQRRIVLINAKALFGEKAKKRRAAEQRIADINWILANEYSDWSEFSSL